MVDGVRWRPSCWPPSCLTPPLANTRHHRGVTHWWSSPGRLLAVTSPRLVTIARRYYTRYLKSERAGYRPMRDARAAHGAQHVGLYILIPRHLSAWHRKLQCHTKRATLCDRVIPCSALSAGTHRSSCIDKRTAAWACSRPSMAKCHAAPPQCASRPPLPPRRAGACKDAFVGCAGRLGGAGRVLPYCRTPIISNFII